MLKFGLGAVASAPSAQDWTIDMLTGHGVEVPRSIKRDISHIKIKNQGSIGSCVAHALSTVVEDFNYRQAGAYKQFSVGFIYGNRKIYNDYVIKVDSEGMDYPYAFNNLLKCGDTYYEDFPWNERVSSVRNRILNNKDALLQKAYPHRPNAYARLYSLDDVKLALKHIGLVNIVIPIYDSIYDAKGVAPVPDTEKEKYYGLHAVVAYGVTDNDEVDIINSWGYNWGDKGCTRLAKGYPIREMWVLTDNVLPTDTSKPVLNPKDFENEVIRIMDKNTGKYDNAIFGLSNAIRVANQEKFHGHAMKLVTADKTVVDEFISPKLIPEEQGGEDSVLKELIVYRTKDDLGSALILHDTVCCPMIELNNDNKFIQSNPVSDDTKIFMIGGSVKPNRNTTLLSGSDRQGTLKAVVDFISTYNK